MDLKRKLQQLRTAIFIAGSLSTGSRRIVKIGGDSIKVAYCTNGNLENDYYIVTVSRVECVSDKLYKKTLSIYEIPVKLVKESHFSMEDIDLRYGQYLVSFSETYVDNKNRAVSGNFGGIKKD